MELDSYDQSIVSLFKEQYSFLDDDIVGIESLKTINNIPEQFNALNILLHNGDIDGIKDFATETGKTTYDDYSYILLKLKEKHSALYLG